MGTCLVSASTGPMGYLLEKLATMLGDECKLLKGVRDSIIIIKDELEALQAFLVPDSEEPDQYTMLRADAVWDMYYKIEDKIDYCMLLVLHHTCPKNGIKKHMSNFKYLLPNKIRYQIAKNIRDIKNQIKEVSDRYRTDEAPPVRLVRIDPRLYAIYKDASELVGIDGPTYKLIEWLTNKKDESPHEQKVVSIVGCAGLGKTTLARQIYNKLQHNFECRAFLSISRSPNMTKIYENIFCQLHNRDYLCDEKGNLNLIIDRIREFIQDKRYLIVIDDVWDTQTWDKLNCALVKNSCGSVIITTTRINRVAQFCCSSHGNLVYNMQPLSVADSKKLFFKRVFGCEETCPSNLKEVSKDILKRCGGLPLAINAISSLLATGETEEKWSHIRSSIAQGENSDIDAMNYILSLSYFDLPHDLRSCLLYVTMFPADFLIEKERLIHRWISEGLIHGGHGEDLVKLGENFLNELVNRSLIETVGLQYDGKARFCRVHHAILDFLIFRSTKENFCTLISNLSKPDGRVCRLSLMGNEDQGSVEQLDLSHARSLGVCGHAGQLPPFVKSNALRVLDLQDCSELGNHHVKDIGRLFRLRYLNISGTDITELPIQIGDLEYLETLDASFTELVELPRPVTGLKRLVRLFVSDETKLPDEIGNMKSLQELGDINAFKQSVNFLNELGNLTDLRKLGIVWDTNGILKSGKGSQKGKRLVSSLSKLNAAKLHALCITFYLREKDGYIGHPFLPALNSTREVYLRRGRICWISKWLLSLANLEKLYISGGDEIEQDDLRTVGSIPTLVEFKLYSGCLGPIIISSGFQQLERLELKFSFSQLTFELGSMPNLKKLDLHIYLSKFKSAGAGFDFGIQHLSSLASVSIVIFCEGVSAAYVEAAEEAFKSMVKAHPNPNRPILEMSRESADFMSQDESQNGAGRCFGE